MPAPPGARCGLKPHERTAANVTVRRRARPRGAGRAAAAFLPATRAAGTQGHCAGRCLAARHQCARSSPPSRRPPRISWLWASVSSDMSSLPSMDFASVVPVWPRFRHTRPCLTSARAPFVRFWLPLRLVQPRRHSRNHLGSGGHRKKHLPGVAPYHLKALHARGRRPLPRRHASTTARLFRYCIRLPISPMSARPRRPPGRIRPSYSPPYRIRRARLRCP